MNIKKRILFTYVVIIVCFSIVSLRLSYVKVIKADEYYQKALDLWTRSAPISGIRGNIYDRNGELIVGSRLTPTIIAIPKQVKDIDDASKKIAMYCQL